MIKRFFNAVYTTNRARYWKRVALGMALYFSTVGALESNGLDLSLIHHILMSISMMGLAELLLSKRDERQRAVREGIRLMRSSTTWIKYLLLIGAALYFHANIQEPADNRVKEVQSMFYLLGMMMVAGYPSVLMIIEAVTHSGRIIRTPFIRLLIAGSAGTYATLWAIGRYGDRLVQWATSSPQELIQVGVLVLALGLLGKFMRYNASSHSGIVRGGAGSSEDSDVRRATEQDIHFIAAHEAGHVLVYGALNTLPEDLEVVVQDKDRRGSLGHVSSEGYQHILTSQVYSEWFMLVLLAGQFAERYETGESTLGSTSDMQQWMRLAQRYLSNQLMGVYYENPSNVFELQSNTEKMDLLQNKQMDMLSEFFDKNREVYRDLVKALIEHHKLNRDDLVERLAPVVVPDGFPVPTLS